MEIFGEETFSADIRAQPFVWIGLGKVRAWTHIKFIHLIWIYSDGVVSCHVSY